MSLFVFKKALNANDYADDAFAVSGLWPITSDVLGFAYEQPTSLGALYTTTRVYSRKYTISTDTLSAEVSVSGAGTYGYFAPSYCGNADNSILFCAYSAGDYHAPYNGFVVKESTDAGATWANSYSGGGSYNNDAQRGLFRDATTGDVFLVTESSRVGGYKINVHKRTGVGTWSAVTAYTGTSANYYFSLETPQQQAVFVNGKALIVGQKPTGIYALVSNDATSSTWTEILIQSLSTFDRRVPKVVRTNDGLVRLMITGDANPVTFTRNHPTIHFSGDLGHTWSTIGTPPGAYMEDLNGNIVGWPSDDNVSFLTDGRGRMYMLVGDENNANLQTYRAWSTNYWSWGLMGTDSITDGTNIYNGSDTSRLPSSAIVVGTDIFRVVSAYITASSCVRAWICKAAGGAIAAGGRSGGGGQPRSYDEGD